MDTFYKAVALVRRNQNIDTINLFEKLIKPNLSYDSKCDSYSDSLKVLDKLVY